MATPQLVKNSNDGSRPGYNGILDWAVENWKDIAKVGGAAAKSYIDYKDQKRRNEVEQAAYNEYLKQVEAAGQEAQAAVDLNLMPMTVTNVPQTKADVSDFTAVAARGGLMNLPTKQRKRYAFGPNPEDIPTMDDMSPPFNPKEEGVIIGEQVFYDTGRGDRANAAQIWTQMDDSQKAPFDFDFEIFFLDGSWSDQIKSAVEVGTETQMAQGPNDIQTQEDMTIQPGSGDMLEIMQSVGAPQRAAQGGIMQAAKGGRIGYRSGGNGNRYSYLIDKVNRGIPLTPPEAKELQMLEITYADVDRDPSAHGGRIGYATRGIVDENIVTDFDEASPVQEDIRVTIKQIAEQSASPESFPATDSDFAALAQLSDKPKYFPSTDYDFEVILRIAKETNVSAPEQSKGEIYANYMARGGRPGYALGTSRDGIMNLGGLEKDYRTTGGFVPLGGRERADDVPARLSKNEFVMTADAVRAAGGGSINRGAQRMYDTMKHLEARPTAKRMTA